LFDSGAMSEIKGAGDARDGKFFIF
jgi:hypothetical protein